MVAFLVVEGFAVVLAVLVVVAVVVAVVAVVVLVVLVVVVAAASEVANWVDEITAVAVWFCADEFAQPHAQEKSKISAKIPRSLFLIYQAPSVF